MDALINGPAMQPGANIVERLITAKKRIGAVAKDGKNVQQNFNFRGIDAVVNACAGHFIDLGILVVPHVEFAHSEMVTYGAKNTVGFRTEVIVGYEFTDGTSSITCKVAAEAIDSGDKGTAKAMSVAYRIALLQALTLPTSERDPDEDSYEVNDPEVARVEALNNAYEALVKTTEDRDEQRAIIQAAIGREMTGKFGDLTMEDAGKIIWLVEDPKELFKVLDAMPAREAAQS